MSSTLFATFGLNEFLEIALRVSQLVVAIIVGFAAVQFYRWQIKTRKKEGFVGAIDKYHSMNQYVIDNPDIQDIECINHFVSADLSRKEVKKMFYYFELLNSMGSILDIEHDKLSIPNSDKGSYYVSVVRNIAKCTYKDREFIKTHCLPRGYTNSFEIFLEQLWEEVGEELRRLGYITEEPNH